MTQFYLSIETKHLAKDVFDLVLDVEKYPSFLPWCLAVRIVEPLKAEIEDAKSQMLADMIISFKGITSQFRSKIITKEFIHESNDYFSGSIEVHQIQGPFIFMRNKWSFTQKSKNLAIVDFHISFEFSSSIFNKMADLFLDSAVKKITDAFLARADKIKSKNLLR